MAGPASSGCAATAASWRSRPRFPRGYSPVSNRVTAPGTSCSCTSTTLTAAWPNCATRLDLYGDSRLAANAVRLYRANLDRTVHDPRLAGLATTSEAPASRRMLVLAGADDGCIPPTMYADAQRGLATGSRVYVVPAAGHFMHLEQPDAVARLVLDWFAGGPPDGPGSEVCRGRGHHGLAASIVDGWCGAAAQIRQPDLICFGGSGVLGRFGAGSSRVDAEWPHGRDERQPLVVGLLVRACRNADVTRARTVRPVSSSFSGAR